MQPLVLICGFRGGLAITLYPYTEGIVTSTHRLTSSLLMVD